MENVEKAHRKRMFSEEQKAELFNRQEPTGDVPLGGNLLLMKNNSSKTEEEILIRVQFKANLETQYLLNFLCKKKRMSRDIFIADMIRQEAKKENIAISIHL
jgi:hypothetical protein